MIKDPMNIVTAISALKRQWLYRPETAADHAMIDSLWREFHEAVTNGAR